MAAVTAVVLALGGCASDEGVTRSVEATGPSRWEAVVMPEATADEFAAMGRDEMGWAWWEERRDSAMAARVDGPMLATDEWPDATRPSLDRMRYLSLPTRSETMIYFRPSRGDTQVERRVRW